VHAHARNLPDDLALAIAKTGGVIGVNFHAPFLSPNAQAGIPDVVRHIRHWVSLLGVNHVAIGSDFEGDIRPAQELGDVRGFPKLAQALLASGFSRAEVSGMFGLNALRVLCDGKRGAKAPPCQ
jgi:membrane dipeptidase